MVFYLLRVIEISLIQEKSRNSQQKFNFNQNEYVAEFNDFDMFTDIYNKLERTKSVTKNSPQSYLNENEGHVEFDGKDFTIYLEGDFNIDEYKITITEE